MAEDLIGKKIENYSIISILGKGGMGTVYKAHDEKLDRFVALKVLDVQVVDKTKFIERFKREARHQAQLSHPNIVTVYGFIDYQGILGIVMEYVQGESLEKVLFRQKRLHIFDVVYIMRQFLSGIGYAHSKGFVHRDIKPSNIILNHEGTVKIMDFGISKSMFDKGLTKTGSKLGTVFYMSPEQIQGIDVDSSTDIYSIGCTIYEMVSGQPPFYNESEYEVMDAHLKKEAPRLAQILPGTPLTIDKIAAKCLQKNPLQRYKNCGEIVEELHELDEYLSKVEAKYFIRTKKDPKRTKFYSILSFALFFVVMSALTYFVYVQVGELLNSGKLEAFKKYNIESLFESDPDSSTVKITTLLNGNGISLNSVSFLSASYGIAVGDSGTVLITADSGRTWVSKELSNKTNFNDISLSQTGYSFISGDNSTLIRSEDFFSTLNYITVPSGFSLLKIKFVDKFTGFILGNKGLILRTADGGEKWQKISSGSNQTLYDISFVDNERAFIVGWEGTLLFTDDGGLTWIRRESFTNKYLKSIDFSNSDLGIIVGGGNTLFRSDDAGESWEVASSNSTGNYHSVKILDDESAICVGSKGAIILSVDDGKTWRSIGSRIYSTITKVYLISSGKIVMTGSDGSIFELF